MPLPIDLKQKRPFLGGNHFEVKRVFLRGILGTASCFMHAVTHGVVSPEFQVTPAILHGVVSPETRAPPGAGVGELSQKSALARQATDGES